MSCCINLPWLWGSHDVFMFKTLFHLLNEKLMRTKVCRALEYYYDTPWMQCACSTILSIFEQCVHVIHFTLKYSIQNLHDVRKTFTCTYLKKHLHPHFFTKIYHINLQVSYSHIIPHWLVWLHVTFHQTWIYGSQVYHMGTNAPNPQSIARVVEAYGTNPRTTY